jgi:alpha/beta superfamily hydrolase
VSDDSGVGVAAGLAVDAGGGVSLAADLAVPPGARAGAVLCHPHPAYGGDRHNPVVDALFRSLPAAGVAALRFDFRPAAGAGGPAATAGARADVVAALDRLAAETGGDLPLWLAGYSFGADVALAVDDARHRGWVAVAPTLALGGPPAPGSGDPRPALLLVPSHDQYSPPAAARAGTAGWPDATVVEVPGADHFLAGATARVADLAVAWLGHRLDAGD